MQLLVPILSQAEGERVELPRLLKARLFSRQIPSPIGLPFLNYGRAGLDTGLPGWADPWTHSPLSGPARHPDPST